MQKSETDTSDAGKVRICGMVSDIAPEVDWNERLCRVYRHAHKAVADAFEAVLLCSDVVLVADLPDQERDEQVDAQRKRIGALVAMKSDLRSRF
jgi:hypothetical protein